jgi:maltooligosyltrehalose trehalohydrolase
VRFRLWAPDVPFVDLELLDEPKQTIRMERSDDGWHETVTASAVAGSRYKFRISDDLSVPDPASKFQPEDVHGPSEVVNPAAWVWTDTLWRGRPWRDSILYELHVGTFTPDGTFRAAIGKLHHLAGLGITAIELMPVGDFPGAWFIQLRESFRRAWCLEAAPRIYRDRNVLSGTALRTGLGFR